MNKKIKLNLKKIKKGGGGAKAIHISLSWLCGLVSFKNGVIRSILIFISSKIF